MISFEQIRRNNKLNVSAMFQPSSASQRGGTAAAVWGLVEPYDYHVFGERYTDAAFLGGAALCHLVRITAWREQLSPHWCVSLIASC